MQDPARRDDDDNDTEDESDDEVEKRTHVANEGTQVHARHGEEDNNLNNMVDLLNHSHIKQYLQTIQEKENALYELESVNIFFKLM